MRDDGCCGRWGEKISVKEKGRGGESELGSDLDPDPWKILWIQIRKYVADPLDPDPHHWFQGLEKIAIFNVNKIVRTPVLCDTAEFYCT